MSTTPFVIERTYNAPVDKVWKAITDKEQMKQWYFDIKDFKLDIGAEFSFTVIGKDGFEYEHLCKMIEVVPKKKLKYSWRYGGQPGNSFVTWELSPDGNKTTLKLTHEGLETFPATDSFKRENFQKGWTGFFDVKLKGFVEEVKVS